MRSRRTGAAHTAVRPALFDQIALVQGLSIAKVIPYSFIKHAHYYVTLDHLADKRIPCTA